MAPSQLALSLDRLLVLLGRSALRKLKTHKICLETSQIVMSLNKIGAEVLDNSIKILPVISNLGH